VVCEGITTEIRVRTQELRELQFHVRIENALVFSNSKKITCHARQHQLEIIINKSSPYQLKKEFPKKPLVRKWFKKKWNLRKKSEEAKVRQAYNFMLQKVAQDPEMSRDPVFRSIFHLNEKTLPASLDSQALLVVEDSMRQSLNLMCATLQKQSEGFNFAKVEHLLDNQRAEKILKMQAMEDAYAYNSLIQQSNRVITLMRYSLLIPPPNPLVELVF